MELELVPPPDDPAPAAAVARAVTDAGVTLRPRASCDGAWWRAGLADAVERWPAVERRPGPYEAAPSPRSTRGATRA